DAGGPATASSGQERHLWPDGELRPTIVPASSVKHRKLRVVTLVHSLIPYGGAERIARLIAAGLDDTRFERTLCISRSPRDARTGHFEATRAELESAGVRVLVLNRRFRFALWPWWPLVRLLRRARVV